MKIYISYLWLLVITGCSNLGPPHDVSIEAPKPLSPEFIQSVMIALEHSRTFQELKQRAKQPLVVIEEEENGWASVWLYAQSPDFAHRWGILRVERNTGRILKLGTDEKLEDKWLVEHQSGK